MLTHGAPGERAVYHSGYYGAFVLEDQLCTELITRLTPQRKPTPSGPAGADLRDGRARTSRGYNPATSRM